MSATGSAPAAVIDQAQVGAHQRQHLEQAGARRIDAHVAIVTGSRAPMQAATMKNAADEKSPGTAMLRRLEPAGGRSVTTPPRADLAAEALQHAFGVVARDRGLDDGRLALAYSPASSTADFTCALATGIS
jgi:hypothetical protein